MNEKFPLNVFNGSVRLKWETENKDKARTTA